ncbi:hypothetical protein GT50_05285 [Geobacillus stearothermophilus 10]|nr:hypothetical protein GT50_05285 [Geobacillus stearothermophilus 10]
MGDLSFRMLGDTFILLEIRQQGLFLCLSEFYLAPRVNKYSNLIHYHFISFRIIFQYVFMKKHKNSTTL